MWSIRPTLENTGLKRAMEQIRKERAVRTWRFFSKFFPGRGWDKRGIYWLPSHRLTRLAFRQKCFEYVFRKRYSISFYIPLFLSFFSSSFFFFIAVKNLFYIFRLFSVRTVICIIQFLLSNLSSMRPLTFK